MYSKAEQTYLSLSNITNFYAYDPEQIFLKKCLIDMLKMLAMGDVASLIRVYQNKGAAF
ncbi:outer membrane MltA-interaction protein MipA [Paenibacillus sp. NAIST15-1]|nr:outer membrane MltA-interaction protein MipA [Paenibacillus sp. NAIST15-1]